MDDFRWGLMEYGISLSKEEGQQVLKHFDKDSNGQVDFSEFLSSLGYSEQWLYSVFFLFLYFYNDYCILYISQSKHGVLGFWGFGV